MNEKQLKYTGLIISIILAVTTIVNMSVTTYVLWNDRQTASMSPNSPENINIAVEADLGRPSPLTYLLRRMQNWFSSYTVGGSAIETATVDLTIQVTGSNVASTASVDYYIEAKETGGSGSPYRFLAGNGSAVSVGGASLVADDERAITSHLTQMGLSTSESWTIDYYVYVIATVTGAISGENLTSEITYTKFDTVTYTFDDPGTWSSGLWAASNGYAGTAEHTYDTYSDASSSSGHIKMGKRTSGPLLYGSYLSFDMVDQSNAPPASSIIQEAYIQLYAETSFSVRLVLISAYEGLDWSSSYIDNYAEWTSLMGQQTTAFSYWGVASAGDGSKYNTTNVKSILQELVDTSGWGSSSKSTFFFDATTSTGTVAPEFYVWSIYKPVLYIRWSSYSASWYDIPPLSIVDMPITLEVGAVLVTAVIAAYILTDIRRRKNDETT